MNDASVSLRQQPNELWDAPALQASLPLYCMLLKTYCDYNQLENTTPGGFICEIPGNNLLILSSILITTQRTNREDLNVQQDW